MDNALPIRQPTQWTTTHEQASTDSNEPPGSAERCNEVKRSRY